MSDRTPLGRALAEGDPAKLAALIEAGADVRYKNTDGYDVLIDAVHGRDVRRDTRLLDLLKLLVAKGAALDGVSTYQALRSEKRLAKVLSLPFDELVLIKLPVIVDQIRGLNKAVAELHKAISEARWEPHGLVWVGAALAPAWVDVPDREYPHSSVQRRAEVVAEDSRGELPSTPASPLPGASTPRRPCP